MLSAIGRPVLEAFDPQHFLEEFCRHLDGMIPHDGAMIAYLEDEGQTATVFAEHCRDGSYPLDDRDTAALDPGGRYLRADWGLTGVFEGEALEV